MDNIDLNRMQIFRQVVAAGSFSKAAAILRQPKSRVSRNIAALERELGVQLIYRTTRHFRVTEAGLDLYSKSLSPLNELSHLLKNLNRYSDELSGAIKISVPEDVGVAFIAEACHKFNQLHPRVYIDLELTSTLVDLVKDGVDIAIRIGHLKDSSLRKTQFGLVQMGLFASPQFLSLRCAGIKTIEDLHGLAFLNCTLQSERGRQLRFRCQNREALLDLDVVFACNNFQVLKTLAVKGMGLAMIPYFLVQTEVEQGSLIPLFEEWQRDPLPIQAVIPQQHKTMLRVTTFLDFIGKQLSPHF